MSDNKNYIENFHIYESTELTTFNENVQFSSFRCGQQITMKSDLSLSGKQSGVKKHFYNGMTPTDSEKKDLEENLTSTLEGSGYFVDNTKLIGSPIASMGERFEKGSPSIQRRNIFVYNENVLNLGSSIDDTVKRETYLPFSDKMRFSGKAYIENTNPENFMDILNDNSRHQLRTYFYGILDPLGTRRYLFDIDRANKESTVARKNVKDLGYFLGISVELQEGNNRDTGLRLSKIRTEIKKGSDQIKDTIDIYERTRHRNYRDSSLNVNSTFDYFDDILQKRTFSNALKPDVGRENPNVKISDYFDDSIDYFNSFVTSTATRESDMDSVFNTIKVNVDDNSEIGSKEISMTAGWVYENTTIGNTTLGTDSLAFGGMNRRI